MGAKELNIGDYVRFDYHRVTVPILIGKIVRIEYDEVEKYYYYATDNGLVIGNENIIKSSPNIIDLIEVGDYVNGLLVIAYNEKNKCFICECCGMECGENWIYKNDDIKSIVTKEQFESMEYKIGE